MITKIALKCFQGKLLGVDNLFFDFRRKMGLEETAPHDTVH